MTRARTPLAPIIAALALVEITSGILQGYYTPILTDIARHLGVHDADVNWLEAAQLMVSALCVPCWPRWAICGGTSASCWRPRP